MERRTSIQNKLKRQKYSGSAITESYSTKWNLKQLESTIKWKYNSEQLNKNKKITTEIKIHFQEVANWTYNKTNGLEDLRESLEGEQDNPNPD